MKAFLGRVIANDIVVRATKTFVQAVLSVLALGVADVVDIPSAKALLVGALSAGISAVWNSLRNR